MNGRGWGQTWPGTDWPGGPWGSGPPPWIAGLFGMGAQQQRAPRARRGDVRAAILDVLAAQPMNGYQVIQQIGERSGGAWKPSPGSVYPTLQQLEDEGLVEGAEVEGRRVLQLTEAGRSYVAEHPDELADTWRAFDTSEGETHRLKPVIGQVMAAVWQIVMSGNRQQQAEAAEILGDARRRLYGLLAEGEPE
ncbi:MAG TPA: PadR family transcriptional regulator [Nocardioidaceae bacterium]